MTPDPVDLPFAQNLSELSKQVTERYAAVDRKKKEIRSIETAKVQKQKEVEHLLFSCTSEGDFVEESLLCPIVSGDSFERDCVLSRGQIREFRSIDRVKMEALMRENRKTFDAWNWIRDNADRFEKPILGPLCLELSVADKESAISGLTSR